ncbi:DUF4089 domain-containing protein [Acidithiobacillus sp. HP-6]|uniref:AtzG-like protein n=1 Tax=unclassified Acidithiobacillus TaxID=2614800 RepID=UPI0018795FDC|nr:MULTISPECIES: AtzG-like protein [unclassified Acidithiobacillus]MBE7563875.1 DUF4089 domain-containing protein [Acidithiobacillus sp. HP-6]MBE7570644.1 DUF4089 domain-containing protein [Acidithiobacillus sp. HP-2]
MPVLKPMSDAMAEQYMQIVFETMDLTVDAAWLPEIRNYFMISARLAGILETYPLAMTEDLAPVFRP